MKEETHSPSAASSSPFTSLRRSTRSLTSSKSKVPDLSSSDVLETPSKKPKIKAPQTPISSALTVAITPKSSTKKPMPVLALEKPHPAPLKWEEQYRLIERMRNGLIAPVDDM